MDTMPISKSKATCLAALEPSRSARVAGAIPRRFVRLDGPDGHDQRTTLVARRRTAVSCAWRATDTKHTGSRGEADGSNAGKDGDAGQHDDTVA